MPQTVPPPASSAVSPAAIPSAPSQLPSAGPIPRLAALAYDSFLIFGLMVTPLFILTGLRAHRVELQTGGVIHQLPPIAPPPVMLLYMLGVIVGFYYYFWRRNGQTLGMQAWRLRLDNASGGRPSFRQSVVRLAVGCVSLLCAGLGYWWIWLDRERLAWHDRASNTRVVVLPKK